MGESRFPSQAYGVLGASDLTASCRFAAIRFAAAERLEYLRIERAPESVRAVDSARETELPEVLPRSAIREDASCGCLKIVSPCMAAISAILWLGEKSVS